MGQSLGQVKIPIPKVGKKAPSEIRLLKWGYNPTLNSLPIYFTKQSAQLLLEEFEKKGRVYSFDVEHSQAPAPKDDERAQLVSILREAINPSAKESAGSHSIEVRDDGLWLTNINWVPERAKEIEDGKWLYLSPWLYQTQTGVVTGYQNSALTNRPAMRNPTPLLYSEKFLSMDTTENQNQPNPLPDATVSELRELQKMSALLSQILAQGQSALNHPNDRIQQIGKAVTSSLPDSIDSVLAYMRELDPNGEFDQPKADKEPDLQLIPKAQTPASSPEQNLYSLCSEVTGETDLKRIRGALLALGQTKTIASKKVQAAQDRAKSPFG